ncbi:MAG: hypothetical protein ACP6IU_11490 [Candidatus Asgardarchaeia archaeon]
MCILKLNINFMLTSDAVKIRRARQIETPPPLILVSATQWYWWTLQRLMVPRMVVVQSKHGQPLEQHVQIIFMIRVIDIEASGTVF